MTFDWQIETAVFLNVFALVLIFARNWLYGAPVYRSKLQNFYRSVTPLFIVLIAMVAAAFLVEWIWEPLGIAAGVAGVIGWLFAVPNYSYVVTELTPSARDGDAPVPVWYDIISVLTFVMSSVVNLVIGVLTCQIFLTILLYADTGAPFDSRVAHVIGVVFIALGAAGIYLGRFFRRSNGEMRPPRQAWNVARSHMRTWPEISDLLLFCCAYTLFLFLVYSLVAAPVVSKIARQGY